MTRTRHPQKRVGRRPRTGRTLTVWAEHRTPPDLDRFVAVLVTLALRRVEAEAKETEADRD